MVQSFTRRFALGCSSTLLAKLVLGKSAFAKTSARTGNLPEVIGPLQTGKGWPFGAPDARDVEQRGYMMEEFILRGTARSYRPKTGTMSGIDGLWDTVSDQSADYVTRVYVVRPTQASKFNGILLVNWQNVTANVDLGWPSEDFYDGYAWAGVTTQKIGIHGLPGVTTGLVGWDPARYGTLHHPGDEYSYDIYSQAARVLKLAPAGGVDPLGGLRPTTVLAIGSSQSAMRLGSYINVAHQHDHFFDGFFLLVHWGLCPPIKEIPLNQQFEPRPEGRYAASAKIHDRGDVPVMVLATESEALHNYPVRQPDTDSFRFWEIAGAAHTDSSNSKVLNPILQRDGIASAFAAAPKRNLVQWNYVSDAAMRSLVSWVKERRPPAKFPLIEIRSEADGTAVILRDRFGNALGGIRLPEIAASTGVHLGRNDLRPGVQLSGDSRFFTVEEMTRIHGSRSRLLTEWDRSVADLQHAGLILPSQTQQILARGREIWPA